LSHRFDNEGDYVVGIRDGMYRGGEQLVYRLTVEQQDPDFIVELREPVKSAYQGQDSTIQVRVRRRAWSAPVEVWAEGLPAGVAVEKQTAEPKNSIVKDTCGVDREIDGTIVLLPLHAAGAPVARSEFRIKGRGVMDGRTVERTAIVRYEHAAAGYTYGPMEVQTAELTIVPQPRVLISAPESITIGPEQETLVNVSVRRFGEAKSGPLTLRTRGSGIRAGEVMLPEASKTAKVPVVLLGNAGPASLVFEAIAADGQPLGESAPVTVRLRQNRETDKPQ
jgi:hypothetical protein